MNTERLRAETREEHEATEGGMPLLREDLTRAEYAEVLARLAGVVGAWERWAEAHAPEDLREMVRVRRRGELLEEDLRSLGAAESMRTQEFAAGRIAGLTEDGGAERFRAGFLGAMYVMEGSRLGGQYLARYFEERWGADGRAGASYFRGAGEHTGSLWREFKAVLAAVPDAEEQTVIDAAKGMFGVFQDGMMAER